MTKLSDLYPPTSAAAHDFGGTAHIASTMAEINTKISDGGISGWTTVNSITTGDYLETTDAGQLFKFTEETTANRNMYLPSVGSDDDGIEFFIENASSYVITVIPADSDSVWTSGDGYGIELSAKSMVRLKYNHSSTNWQLIAKSGDSVKLTGLKLQLKFNTLFDNHLEDEAKRHKCPFTNGTLSPEYKFDGVSGDFNGANSNVAPADPDDWDIFSSTLDDWTIEFWIYCDNATGLEYILGQYEDAQNKWFLVRPTSSTALNMVYELNNIVQFNTGGGTFNASTWYHVVLVKVGSETGLYQDGIQIAYDASFTAGSIVSAFNIGNVGLGTGVFDGRIDQLTLINQNIYNLAPNVDKTDTITGFNTKMRIIAVT